jgi:amphi-Trp domain-containing protein
MDDDSLDITEENIGKIDALIAAIKGGQSFVIEVDGERVEVPAHAGIEIEYDTEDGAHELEIQFYWHAGEPEDADEADDEVEDADED